MVQTIWYKPSTYNLNNAHMSCVCHMHVVHMYSACHMLVVFWTWFYTSMKLLVNMHTSTQFLHKHSYVRTHKIFTHVATRRRMYSCIFIMLILNLQPYVAKFILHAIFYRWIASVCCQEFNFGDANVIDAKLCLSVHMYI